MEYAYEIEITGPGDPLGVPQKKRIYAEDEGQARRRMLEEVAESGLWDSDDPDDFEILGVEMLV